MRITGSVSLLIAAALCTLVTRASAALSGVAFAINKGKQGLLRVELKKEDVDVNAPLAELDSMPPLHYTILHQKPEFAKMIIEESSPDVTLKDKMGAEPLDITAFRCDLDTAKLLYAKHPAAKGPSDEDPLQKAYVGFPLLHRTTWEWKLGERQDCVNYISWLIENGVNVDTRSSMDAVRANVTALMEAAIYGQEHHIDVLLLNKADPNLVDEHGNTAAHLLSKGPTMYAHMQSIYALKRNGANFDLTNNDNKTAEDLLLTHYENAIKANNDPKNKASKKWKPILIRPVKEMLKIVAAASSLERAKKYDKDIEISEWEEALTDLEAQKHKKEKKEGSGDKSEL